MSDLQSVIYFVSGQGGGALQGAVSSPGLARTAGDRLFMQMADQQGNTGAMAANTRIIAPEVTSITFYYYDGTNWVYSWDSSVATALPKAVEIVLELATVDAKKPTALQATTGSTQVYRLTVALPAARPVVVLAQ